MDICKHTSKVGLTSIAKLVGVFVGAIVASVGEVGFIGVEGGAAFGAILGLFVDDGGFTK